MSNAVLHSGIDAFFPIIRGVSSLKDAMEPERAKLNKGCSRITSIIFVFRPR